jgi:8-oxo-dGTP pyrophosphatase MutT (NUDIX family)
MEWKVLESDYLFNQPWLTIRKEKCELPNGTVMPAYYILEYPEWVSVLALTKEGKAVFVKQYRHGLGVVSIEVPGGVVDAGETPDLAAKRELMEETGYQFDTFEYLGKVSPNPATSTNYMHMYLAQGGVKVAAQSLDETEDVDVALYTLEEVKSLIRDNKIVQSLHVTTLFYGLNKLGLVTY